MEEGKERFHRRCISQHEGEGMRRRTREREREREREKRGCLFYRAFTLHLSGTSGDRQGEPVSYNILLYMKNGLVSSWRQDCFFNSIIFFRKPNKHSEEDVEIHGSPVSRKIPFVLIHYFDINPDRKI